MMIKEQFLAAKENTSLKEVFWVSLCTVIYLACSSYFIGFKTDQLFLVVLFHILYYLSLPTRKFILGFSIFIVFWIIFDSMKAYPNYNFNTIHILDLYLQEKYWFGMVDHGILLTPNEYAAHYSQPMLDVLSGLFYLTWVPVPLLFAFYLFKKDKMQFLYFALSFLLVNLLGFVVYYGYPAAPPWYVHLYGFELHFNTPGNPAGLARFDDYFGIQLFHSMYAKSSNVFAAMPSLHSAYPVVAFYYGIKNRLGWVNVLFFIMMCGIWFSAVYSMHHYIIDVIAGVTCALVGLLLFDRVLVYIPWVKKMLFRYHEKIA